MSCSSHADNFDISICYVTIRYLLSSKSKTIIWREITSRANNKVIYNLYEKDEKFRNSG